MIIENFIINNWKVIVYIAEEYYDLDELLKLVSSIGCTSDCICQLYKDVTQVKYNIGFTFSNMLQRESIIIIGLQDDENQLVNTISHESRHLQQHIANYYKLDENSEDVCYLIAEIVQSIYNICKKYQLL